MTDRWGYEYLRPMWPLPGGRWTDQQPRNLFSTSVTYLWGSIAPKTRLVHSITIWPHITPVPVVEQLAQRVEVVRQRIRSAWWVLRHGDPEY